MKTIMAKVKKMWFVPVDGPITRVEGREGKELSLQHLYLIIGCTTVEHVGLAKGVDMWVDEEGLLVGKEYNHRASQMYRAAYPHVPPQEIGIVGDAVVTDNTKEGNFISQ